MLALVCATVGFIYAGFVLATLWNWFAVPFTAVRLGTPEAVGLILLTWSIRGRRHQKDDRTAWQMVRWTWGSQTFALAWGFAAHLWLARS